jgi:hypothetical protein
MKKGDEVTPELDFVFSTLGEDYNGGSWGISFSGTHQVRHNREEGTNEITWNPSTEENYLAPKLWSHLQTKEKMVHSSILEILFTSTKITKELEIIFKLHFSMSLEELEQLIDYTYSNVDFRSTGVENGAWFAGYNARNVTINENGAVIYSDDIGREGIGREYFNRSHMVADVNRNNSLGFNLDFQVTEDLNVTFDMHNSSATKKGTGLDNSILFSNAMWSSSRSRTDGTWSVWSSGWS